MYSHFLRDNDKGNALQVIKGIEILRLFLQGGKPLHRININSYCSRGLWNDFQWRRRNQYSKNCFFGITAKRKLILILRVKKGWRGCVLLEDFSALTYKWERTVSLCFAWWVKTISVLDFNSKNLKIIFRTLKKHIVTVFENRYDLLDSKSAWTKDHVSTDNISQIRFKTYGQQSILFFVPSLRVSILRGHLFYTWLIINCNTPYIWFPTVRFWMYAVCVQPLKTRILD